MQRKLGLRDRKKAQTRHRLADVAARLFAEHGYDAVAVVDVARAADVSDQTVYNYFANKQDLVLDRAEEIRERYGRLVLERPERESPANALRVLVAEDIDRYRQADLTLAPGEFPALCLKSSALRRFALEAREQQSDTISAAILTTCPTIHPIVARAHAAGLISVIQTITDCIGSSVLCGAPIEVAAKDMMRDADEAFGDLDRSFRAAAGSTSIARTAPP